MITQINERSEMHVLCVLVQTFCEHQQMPSIKAKHIKHISFFLTFMHRASRILGQAFHYTPENAFYIFNQQIYFII